MLTCAWVAISMLRRVLGCSLDIELWHIGPGELGELEAALFRTLDVEIIDALEVRARWPARKLGGWELKAYALVHSRFEQVLLLDADNVPATNPEYLFEVPEFAGAGALVWPDLERLTEENPIWELCGVPFRSEPAWESGQLFLDKSRCWRALLIALHMNMHSETFYPYTHGDKETFHLAWILAGAGWAMPDYPARSTTTGIYQRDFDGRLAFQHRTDAKWRLSGENQLSADFRHQAECLSFLSELRQRWSGMIGALPPRSERDGERERSLIETRWYSLEEPGRESRLLELLEGSRVGIGSARERMLRWYVRGEILTLDGAAGALPPLSAQVGGRWLSDAAAGGLSLLPVPDAGLDALGATAAAVIEHFAQGGAITEDDAVTTLATLAQVGDLSSALQRARSRWEHSDDALGAIERAGRRAGLKNPSAAPSERAGYERLR